MHTELHATQHIRNALLKAFLINYLCIFAVWLFTMTGLYEGLVSHFYHLTKPELDMYSINFLGFWKIIAFVLFLAPALAIHWEFCRNKD